MLDIQEYLQSNRYKKSEEKILLDLNTALDNAKSQDPKIRKLGEKRLSSHARRELGWNCLPVREWFLKEKNQKALFDVIQKETEPKLLGGYLLTLAFFYERYITHGMWEEIFDKKVKLEYEAWIKKIIELHIDHTSSLVKTEISYLLSIVKDKRAWDMFNEVLLKKSSIINWVFFACDRYAKNSITQEQLKAFIVTFKIIKKKTKNKSVKEYIDETKAVCQELIGE